MLPRFASGCFHLCGGTHTSVALVDGTVMTWGDNSFGQTNIPLAITGVTQITGKAMNTIVLVDDAPPTPVTNLNAPIVTSSKVTLNWTYPDQPTDRDIAKFVVRGTSGDVAPVTINDGYLVETGRDLQLYATDYAGSLPGERYSYSGSGTKINLGTALAASVTDSGLVAGMTYSYAIFAQDRVGNVSPLGSGSVTTVTTTAESPA